MASAQDIFESRKKREKRVMFEQLAEAVGLMISCLKYQVQAESEIVTTHMSIFCVTNMLLIK